jgi:hypothetical protein
LKTALSFQWLPVLRRRTGSYASASKVLEASRGYRLIESKVLDSMHRDCAQAPHGLCAQTPHRLVYTGLCIECTECTQSSIAAWLGEGRSGSNPPRVLGSIDPDGEVRSARSAHKAQSPHGCR